MALVIDPQTHGTLAIAVKDNATPVTDAVVVATIRDPANKTVATNISCPHAGSGIYNLTILPEWSESAGKPFEGVFHAEVKATRAGKQRVKRIYYVVVFDKV